MAGLKILTDRECIYSPAFAIRTAKQENVSQRVKAAPSCEHLAPGRRDEKTYEACERSDPAVAKSDSSGDDRGDECDRGGTTSWRIQQKLVQVVEPRLFRDGENPGTWTAVTAAETTPRHPTERDSAANSEAEGGEHSAEGISEAEGIARPESAQGPNW